MATTMILTKFALPTCVYTEIKRGEKENKDNTTLRLFGKCSYVTTQPHRLKESTFASFLQRPSAYLLLRNTVLHVVQCCSTIDWKRGEDRRTPSRVVVHLVVLITFRIYRS